jgi:cell wall-associated NlpC family hydrolase
MVKQTLPLILLIILSASCTTLKQLVPAGNKQMAATAVQPRNSEVKFIDDISVDPNQAAKNNGNQTVGTRSLRIEETIPVKTEEKSISDMIANRNRTGSTEKVSPVQLKYANLLNTEVSMLPDQELLKAVDEWYGVRYRSGGNTKKGVDCSGFTVAVYAAVYGISLPRVSRDQYRTARHISSTELQEGDLLFFDTRGRGSISHVGIYLGNNKFIHASVSKGVMVSGMFEPYYLQRYVGAGRLDNKQVLSLSNNPVSGSN